MTIDKTCTLLLLSCALVHAQQSDTVNPFSFGGIADGTQHPITQNDIDTNTQWLGCGTADTNGTAVTWDSGAKFYPDLSTYTETINIGGTSYTVAGIGPITGGSATTLTLSTDAGVQTAARWC